MLVSKTIMSVNIFFFSNEYFTLFLLKKPYIVKQLKNIQLMISHYIYSLCLNMIPQHKYFDKPKLYFKIIVKINIFSCTVVTFVIIHCFRKSNLKYTDCISPSSECPRYDIKQSDGEASVMLELLRMRRTPLLPSLLRPLWSRVVAPERVLSQGQIEVFDI